MDVITRLSYQVDDGQLSKSVGLLQQQVQNVAVYAQRLQNLQNTFDRTATSETEKRNRLLGLMQRQKSLIDQTTASIQKQITSNQLLQNAIVKEIGLLNTLDLKLKDLQEQRRKAFSVADIDRFNKQIAATQKQITALTTSSKSIFGGLSSSILQGVGIGTGIGLVTQGVGEIRQFIADSSRLAAEAEGVTAAFERLNRPDLLNNLRSATKGTVSDLELMKNAINFNNFGLPIEKLGIALEFARRRAKDTGQEVDYLVQSIVTGIGRQSPLILDNLGINAKRVATEFQRTGNFAEAAFNIISEETKKAGADLDTFAEKQARLNAQIQNLKVQLGGVFNEIVVGTGKAINAGIDKIAFLFLGGKSIDAEIDRTRKEIEAERNKGRKPTPQNTQLITPRKIDFQGGFTQAELLAMSKPELEKLKESGENQINEGLVVSQKDVDSVKDKIGQIDKVLERFSTKVKETKRKVKEDTPVKTKDLFEMTPEEWAEDIDKRVAALNKFEKEIKDFRAQVDKDIEKPEGIQSLSELIGQESGFGESSQADATRLQLGIQLAREQRVKDEAEKERARNEKEIRDERVRQEIQAYQSIVNAAVNAYNAITNAQLAAQDVQIAAQQRRVDQATELYKQGNVEVLKLEQERLDESIKKREEIARRQQIINAALTVSESILAIATAAGETGAGAIVIVPAVIAAIAAGFAAVTALSQENQQGFKDGVVDYQGKGTEKSDSNTVKISKGESVITAEATKKYKTDLEAMNAGTYRMVQIPKQVVAYHNSFATKGEMKGVEGKLDALIALNQNNGVSVKQNIDGNGVLQIVESNKRRDNQRFK